MPPLTVVAIKRKKSFIRLPSARLLRNIILLLLAVTILWLTYPFVERFIALRGQSVEEPAPGHLDLPPANHLVRAQFWVRPNPTDPDHGQHFWLGYGAAHVQETLSTNLGCGFLADGSIIARSDGYPVIGAFQHDAWYRVQLSANIPDQTFSIFFR